MSYLPIFPAFLKLRKIDPNAERPFRVHGTPLMLQIMAWVPFGLLILSILFCAVPMAFDAETLASVLPITIGSIICIIIGEVLAIAREKKNGK